MHICAKGPNNTMLTANINMHGNMERPRYAESVCDQRSMYSRRETSPMSFYSASGIHSRNLHHSYYPGGMSSQRSMFNGRTGSSMSEGTVDSNTSQATDIALALKTRKFNKYDLKIIRDAYNQYIKCRSRKRIEKRRNLRTFLKYRRISGGESGDQASDSSLSSDDQRSVRSSRTATFNNNASSSSRINIMNLKQTMKESGMYRDRTEHLRQNRFVNMLSVPSGRMQESLQHRLNTSIMSKNGRHEFLLPSQRFNANRSVASLPIPEMPNRVGQMTNGIQNKNQNKFNQKSVHTKDPRQEPTSEQEEIFSKMTMMQKNNETKSQRKRVLEEENNTSLMFKNGRHEFLLPSQRFNVNRSVASLPIPEMPNRVGQMTNGIQNKNQNKFNQKSVHTKDPRQEPTSEQEEIFSKMTMMQKNNETKSQRKRVLEEENTTSSGKKKNKLSTPAKNFVNSKVKQITSESNNKGNDFQFAKPQLPALKPVSVKNLIVKSQIISSGKSKSLKTCDTVPYKTQTPQIISNSQQQETSIWKSRAPLKEIISQIRTKETLYQSPEKLISKSSQPLYLEQQRALNLSNNYEKDQHEMAPPATDMSMRPSFIKRKLFTQKVDETENTGSTESLQTQSPQSNIYSKIQKEKNKTRKLVTQSCLSRELGDNSNLLELIHKIVPPDRMNLTAATNKSEIQINKSKTDNSDKWDITSIITTNESGELSDTYTDDEIFNNDETKQNHAKNKQNDVKENKKKEMVNKTQATNNNNSTLKTIAKQCKPLNTKIVRDSNVSNNNKVLLNNSEKAETYKKTDTNNRTNNCSRKQSFPIVMLQSMSPQIVSQKRNVKNIPPNKEPTTKMETNDFNKKTKYCLKDFWDESDTDNAATPVKKPEFKGKGLTNLRAMNDSISNQRNNTQNERSMRQGVTAKTCAATNTILHTAQEQSHILDDMPNKGEVIQSKEKTVERLQVRKNEKNQIKKNKGETFVNVLKSKQNNTESSKKPYTKPTPTATKANASKKEDTMLKINDNPLQIRSQRIPKNNTSCADPKLNVTKNTSNESQLCRTLRSRVIDLSILLDKENPPSNKKAGVRNKQKPVRNKNVTKVSDKENISNTSDQSFTLSSETPKARRLVANKRVNKVNTVKLNVTKSRQSDVSFTLGEKVLNHTSTHRRRPKEVEKLQLGTTKIFNSHKKSPLSKRVESTRLNKSRSSSRLGAKYISG